jgi:hypothetical protein
MEIKIKDIAFELLQNASENISVETNGYLKHAAILNDNLGERQKDLTSVICLIGVYIIIFITGLIGNVSTCIVILRNSYMRNRTNCYLFSLAISDLLTLTVGKCHYYFKSARCIALFIILFLICDKENSFDIKYIDMHNCIHEFISFCM